MTEWGYAQQDPSEELAKLHFFTIKTVQAGQAIEFTITVKEYVTPPLGAMTFFAQADKQTNQRTAPYTLPIRLPCPAHSRSRSTNFWILPVEVFGSGSNAIESGHL